MRLRRPDEESGLFVRGEVTAQLDLLPTKHANYTNVRNRHMTFLCWKKSLRVLGVFRGPISLPGRPPYPLNRQKEGTMSVLIYPEESYAIVGSCFEVYKSLGCGFLEAVYQECLDIEFGYRQIRSE